jgi:uncharacterized protein (TIGR02246 family)
MEDGISSRAYRRVAAHASGNYGLLDLVAALHWVHDNICVEGDHVTLARSHSGVLNDRIRVKFSGRIIMTADEGAIQDILKQLEIAWNGYDSVSVAALFAEDANFIQIFGGQLDGRTAIEASHRHIFNTIYRGSHASFVLRSIRFVRPDVAIVFARARVNFTEGNETREIETRPTLIVVKEEAKWQIVAFQNTRISEMPAAAQGAGRLAT